MQTKRHILYCEDHDDTRAFMTIMLERAGLRVTAARNGTECLKLAEGQQFDLYLLDHTFPDASGVTICEAIRKFDADTFLFRSRDATRKRSSDESRGAGLPR
jgi:two-component system OmpR family response regulator